METMIKEFKFNGSNMVQLVQNSDTSDFTVRYMMNRVLSFKIFETSNQALCFFRSVKSLIEENNS